MLCLFSFWRIFHFLKQLKDNGVKLIFVFDDGDELISRFQKRVDNSFLYLLDVNRGSFDSIVHRIHWKIFLLSVTYFPFHLVVVHYKIPLNGKSWHDAFSELENCGVSLNADVFFHSIVGDQNLHHSGGRNIFEMPAFYFLQKVLNHVNALTGIIPK